MQGLASDRFLKKFAGNLKKRHKLPAPKVIDAKPDDEAGNIETDNPENSPVCENEVVEHDPEDHPR
jgi:hypothetical protein